jgi:polysaccharide pyruvyl transferase WcaK-like protein
MKALQNIVRYCAEQEQLSISLSFLHNRLRSTSQFRGILRYWGGRTDVVILGSGGLFPKNRIRNFAKFLILGTKCKNRAFLGIGVDPILRYTKAYRMVFEKTKFIITRDYGSLANVAKLNPRNVSSLSASADLVIAAKGLLFSQSSDVQLESNEKIKSLWVCIKCDRDPRHFIFYEKLMSFMNGLGIMVKFVAFGEEDRNYAKRLQPQAENIFAVDANNVSEIFSQINVCDVVLAERYHGIILSLIFKKRFVPLVYDYKHLYLLDDIGFEYERHFLNYDEQGHLSRICEANASLVADDLFAARSRSFEKYYDKIEEISRTAFDTYCNAINVIIHGEY